MKILLPEIHRRGTCPFSRDPQVNFQVFCIFKQYPIADPGCLSRTPDPNFYHPGSRIRIKEFKYFKPKKMVSKLWEIWSGLFVPDRSGSWLFTHPGSRIQGSKRHRIPDPDPQHWFQVVNLFDSVGDRNLEARRQGEASSGCISATSCSTTTERRVRPSHAAQTKGIIVTRF